MRQAWGSGAAGKRDRRAYVSVAEAGAARKGAELSFTDVRVPAANPGEEGHASST